MTFAGADTVLAVLRELCPQYVDGRLPVWVRNLSYRLLLLQRPDEPELMREAAFDLRCNGPDWDDVAAGLLARAEELESS
ncbi:hypothetical protein ACIA8O_16805 [Kitasatospora sp. NPDC051853]|uniref:hypothetical protein n=1 Tax=Kitasatospora sp. NPDC051853 TaxID=3364058 RepID=UPI0037AC44F6